MLDAEAVTNVLHALSTGYLDRALNVVAMSPDLDDDARSALYQALAADNVVPEQARRFGDALRALGADSHLVNECYRVAFYTGDGWVGMLGNPLFGYAAANRAGRPLDKWVHYFPIYDRHLTAYRGRPIRVLEIGVYRGGGLDMLRWYLGPAAYMVGIDIDDAARAAVGGRHAVEIGDQADPDFLRRVNEEHGPFDVVIDDGGHSMLQQVASVETLFPLLAEGGTYLIEDCHTSYWPEYADQPPGSPSLIDWAKARMDDLNAYHYSKAAELDAPWQTRLVGMHVYDSVVVLDSGTHAPPFSELSGTKEFLTYSRPAAAIHLEMLATRDAAVARATDVEREASARIAEVERDAEARIAAAEADSTARVNEAERAAETAIATAESRLDGLIEEVRVLRAELIDARQATATVRADLDSLDTELAHTRGDLLGAWGIIQEMRRSASWRVTTPLRRVRSVIRRQ